MQTKSCSRARSVLIGSLLSVGGAVAVALGVLLSGTRGYAFSMVALVVLALLPLLFRFEKRKHQASELMILAALIAFTVCSRIALFAIPGVKPVTAIVILTAIYLGPDNGFAVGVYSALLSDLFFGIGSWTPFQMFAWGVIGLLAGWIARFLRGKRVLPVLFSLFAGVLFSLLMDVWTVLSANGTFSLPLFAAACASSLPFTAVYAISNAVFLLLLMPASERIFPRLSSRYGVF